MWFKYVVVVVFYYNIDRVFLDGDVIMKVVELVLKMLDNMYCKKLNKIRELVW